MPLWSASVIAKVILLQDGQKQIRRLTLPSGSSTPLSEFIALLTQRFGSKLESRATYTDKDGDTITITTDSELRDALQSGIEQFQVAVDTNDDDWEILGQPHPAALQKNAVSTQWKNSITFWVNGEMVTLQNPKPSLTLLDWLREEHGLLGTHVGCGEGGCGICTVALVLPTGETVPINSCLRRLVAVDGCHIVNTQGLGSMQGGLHKVQTAIADGNGSQCGFCTPGWVMNMYSLLERNPRPSQEEIEQNFDGNLCRCTGYRPILSAFGEFAEGGECCGSHKSVRRPVEMHNFVVEPLHFVDSQSSQEYYRPVSMEQLNDALQQAQSSRKVVRYICGNTAEGVVKYLAPPDRDEFGTVFVDLNELSDLRGVAVNGSSLTVGSLVSLTGLIDALEQNVAIDPAFTQYAEHIKRVASVQIRAVGSWAGNLMLCRESTLNRNFAYFPSDLVLVLATAGARVRVSVNQQPETTVDPLQLTRLRGDNVLVLSMEIPIAPPGSVVRTFKAMQRHVFSHPIVNFGAHITLQADQTTVKEARIIVGGATSTLISAERTATSLRGSQITQATLSAAMTALISDIQANPSDDQVSTPEFRQSCALGFLYKTFLEFCNVHGGLPDKFESAIAEFAPASRRPVSSGADGDFSADPAKAPFGTWVPKLEARIQASGEARYASDMGLGALFSQIVFSTSCNATLSALDATDALRMPGVKAFVTAADVPGVNSSQAFASVITPDWKVFFEIGDSIPAIGMPLGLIVADTWAQARLAAKKIVQRYTDAGVPVVSAEVAAKMRHISHADNVAAVRAHKRLSKMRRDGGIGAKASGPRRLDASKVARGTFKTGAQNHMYLETQSACVVPVEGDRWDVYSSTQWPDLVHDAVALVLAVPKTKITVKNTRCGGGFGGKIAYPCPAVTAVAVAARKFGRPVRLQNERSDDMQMCGQRHPIDITYEATFDSDGKIDALVCSGASDVGWVAGVMAGMGEGAAGLMDNNYNWNVLTPSGQDVLTNRPNNTAMRAPPTMQAALAGDVVMEHVARSVGKDLDDIMQLNFYKEGDVTAQGDLLGSDTLNFTVPHLWEQIQRDTRYAERKHAVETYNANNRWTKKGIAITTSKWIGSARGYENSAHVSIYDDGTVQVASGGVEIGQGLNTKVAMAAAFAFGIPLEKISVGQGDTAMLPNNGTTGGSGTSEACAQAVLYACQELTTKLQPYLDNVGGDFTMAVAAAKASGESLVAIGWSVGQWDKKDDSKNSSSYLVYGACVSEVLLDVLTGDVRVEKADILMDLGHQLNAAVDVGQVQGGFVQALGYLFTERMAGKRMGRT